MNNLKELKIWSKAIDLAVDVYKVTSSYPTDERFGLINQSRRAVVSIPSNIAEGAGRNSPKEFNNFLGIANGSTYELITQLMISKRLKLIAEEKISTIINELVEVSNMNFALQRSLKK